MRDASDVLPANFVPLSGGTSIAFVFMLFGKIQIWLA
jgi:hypothetical protein